MYVFIYLVSIYLDYDVSNVEDLVLVSLDSTQIGW
jgi:hypothetical protein